MVIPAHYFASVSVGRTVMVVASISEPSADGPLNSKAREASNPILPSFAKDNSNLNKLAKKPLARKDSRGSLLRP